MEAQETKSITESSFNYLKQYIIDMALIPLLKWLMLRQLPRPIKAAVASTYNKLTDKHGSAIKKVESDGNTKEKDYTDNLTFEEFVEMSNQAEKDGIVHYGIPKDEIPDEDKRSANHNIGLDTKAKLEKFREAKTMVEIRKEQLDKLAKKGVTGRKFDKAEMAYNSALKEYNKLKKDYDGRRFVFVCNASHQQWAKKQFDEILEKRNNAYNVAESKFLKETIENERNNASEYDKVMADNWIESQRNKGAFDGSSKEEIDLAVRHHFEKSGIDGTVKKDAYKNNYCVHTVSAVEGAKIANILYQRETNNNTKQIEFYVEHDKDTNGNEVARIFVKDDDIGAYRSVVNVHQGEIKHVGSNNNNNKVSDFNNTAVRAYALDDNVSLTTINEKLKDCDYEIRYKKNEDNIFAPIIYVDAKAVEKYLQEEVSKEQELSSLQFELDNAIASYNAQKEIGVSENTIEIDTDKVDFDTDIDISIDD